MTTVADIETTPSVNGIDVQALNQTIEAITDTPSIAKFNFRTHNRWIDGPLNRTAIKGFYGADKEDTSREEAFIFDSDQPPVLLGLNRGPNPVEFILHGLAGCLTTTLVYHAAKRGVTLTEVESKIDGHIDLRGFLGLDESVRPGFQSIHVNIHVKGDAPKETLDELIEITKQRSPGFDTITNEIPVEIHVVQHHD